MKKLLLLFACILLFSCSKENHITRSFCFWKTQLTIDNRDSLYLDSLKVKHMYMRYFDVGWSAFDNEPRPTATLNAYWDTSGLPAITPSVYIKNDVFLYSSRDQLKQLAVRITDRIGKVTSNISSMIKVDNEIGPYPYGKEDEVAKWQKQRDSIHKIKEELFSANIKDILIDCDWTPKSKGNYFFFLAELKRLVPQYKLSATIRLWQYRDYEQSGMPPVDRGLLMCYNMQSAENYDIENSLATSAELKKYITHDDYKLPLDVALPVFSWSVVFRNGKFLGINRDISPETDTVTYTKKGDNRYVFNRDKVIGETYYRYGDEIRVEKTSSAEMEKMISILKDNINLENSRVTFFSWDQKYLNNYGISTLSGYYSLF